jgi:translation initiation factor 3 subunit A
LILLANCDLLELEEKNRILPKVMFFIEVSKIILDVIRQNCRLLHLYNQVAISLFQFAEKYNCRKEYIRLSDMLHAHFLQIQKAHKVVGQNDNRIPHPVRLTDNDTVIKLLELRHFQLEQALKMKEWTDGYRTCETIYTLMNKQEQSNIKGHLQNFFRHLVQIFWKSNNHLFHAFALQNLLSIGKSSLKISQEEKLSLASEFVFAALSVPLSNKLTTHERISSDYLPKDIQDEVDMSQIVSHEIFKVAQMLQI